MKGWEKKSGYVTFECPMGRKAKTASAPIKEPTGDTSLSLTADKTAAVAQRETLDNYTFMSIGTPTLRDGILTTKEVAVPFTRVMRDEKSEVQKSMMLDNKDFHDQGRDLKDRTNNVDASFGDDGPETRVGDDQDECSSLIRNTPEVAGPSTGKSIVDRDKVEQLSTVEHSTAVLGGDTAKEYRQMQEMKRQGQTFFTL